MKITTYCRSEPTSTGQLPHSRSWLTAPPLVVPRSYAPRRSSVSCARVQRHLRGYECRWVASGPLQAPCARIRIPDRVGWSGKAGDGSNARPDFHLRYVAPRAGSRVVAAHGRVRRSPTATTMASLAARALPLARTQPARIQTRLLSTTRVVRQEATPNLGAVPPAKKPVGAFRGGCVLLYCVRYQRLLM